MLIDEREVPLTAIAALLVTLAAACGASRAVPAHGGAGGGGTSGSGALGTGGGGGSGGGLAGNGASAGNAGGAAGGFGRRPGDVVFSVPSQTFRDRLSVAMVADEVGGEIRYTTDGQPPGAMSTLYDGSPLQLTATTQLRAQTFIGGAPAGGIATALYIARGFDFTSSLPVVVVDGYGGDKPTDKEVYLDAAVMIFEPVEGTASLANLPTLASRAGYHVRGQSSARFPQTPYKIELWSGHADVDQDHPVLGMPADSDWALIAPYYDRTLIRNPFVYELGRAMGLQAPRTRFAEVYINYAARPLEPGDYQGIYWVTETIKNTQVRTNLAQLDDSDTTLPRISGGYIFKFDQAASEPPRLTCTGSPPLSGGLGRGGAGGDSGTCWRDLEVVDPDPLNEPQAAWLTQYIQAFHDSLHANPIGDYAAYIDLPTFVDYLIINELTFNVDAYTRSAFFHKDRDGKIEAGPLWDYNFSLAVGGSTAQSSTVGWKFQARRNVNNWYPMLTAQAPFMDMVKARWKALRADLLSQEATDERIADLIAPLMGEAIARDYARWPVATVYANSGLVRGPAGSTFDEQVQALRAYIAERVAWIDSQLE